MNFIIIFGTALIPMLMGFLWYNNSFGFGKLWMAENGTTEEELNRNFNPIKVFGFAYFFGVLLAGALVQMVIHQSAFASMMVGTTFEDATSETGKAFKFIMDTYGQNYRTFKHGAFHGLFGGIFMSLPLVGITALFERRSWKYIFMHVGYWMVTMALMGGIICQFLAL
jgi:hypothetical protein